MKTFRQLISENRPNSTFKGRPSMQTMAHPNTTPTLVQSFRSLAYKQNIAPISTRSHIVDHNLADTQLFTQLIKGHREQNKSTNTKVSVKNKIKINRKVDRSQTNNNTPLRDLKAKIRQQETTAIVLTPQQKQIESDTNTIIQKNICKLVELQVSQCCDFTSNVKEAEEVIKGSNQKTLQKMLEKRSLLCSSIKSLESKQEHDESETPRFQLTSNQKTINTDRFERSLIKYIDQALQLVQIQPVQLSPIANREILHPQKQSRFQLNGSRKMQSSKNIKNRLLLGNRSNNSSKLEI